jgi:hypothetical protein
MRAGRKIFFHLAGLIALLIISNIAFADTVRERAESHFNLGEWTTNVNIAAPAEVKATSIPGGNETFPVLTPSSDTGIVSLYPELEGLGKLDYTGIEPALLTLLQKTGESFKDRDLPTALCSPDFPFLSPVNTFRLKKLPEVLSVYHSRPVMSDIGVYSVIFRLQCVTAMKRPYVFITVSASMKDAGCYILDVVFDGETYAALAQQN